MGLVSSSLMAGAVLTLLVSLTGRDRTVTALAALITLNLLASLLVHWSVKGVGRSTPLMLIDSIGLYLMCLVAVCRLDRPLWLYGLCVATALQCLAHVAYVAGWLRADDHILALNLLFIGQLACLIAGRWGAPELDLRDPSATGRSDLVGVRQSTFSG